MKSDTLGTIFTGILSICATAITIMLVRREFFPPAEQRRSAVTTISNWKDFQGGQALTPSGHAVTLVVFSDYQCPACRALSRNMDSLLHQFPTQLSVYYRNAPIPSHPFARAAAYAAECAARDHRFVAAHRVLFTQAESIGVRSWGRFATAIGMSDTTAFNSCIRDSVPMTIIRHDEDDARRIGVQVTPTLLLDDERIDGAVPVRTLSEMIQKHFKKAGTR